MTDDEIYDLGRESFGLFRDACLNDPRTMSRRLGFEEATEGYDALEAFLDPQKYAGIDGWDTMHLATSCMLVIATDQAAFAEMFSLLRDRRRGRDDDYDLSTATGVWKLVGFLSAVADDNDYSIDLSGSAPRIGLQAQFDRFLPTQRPQSLLENLRAYAEEIALGSAPRP